MKAWKYFCLCFCLVFSYTGQASTEVQINHELTSRLSCEDRHVEKLCYLSIDNRGNELVIFLSSAAYRMEGFSKTHSFLDAANLAHEVYQSINVLIDDIGSNKPNNLPIILIMEVMFKGERVTVIHDENDTLLVDLDRRIDVYQLLNDHRELVSQSITYEQERNTLKVGESLVAKYEVTNTYNVVSKDAVQNSEAGTTAAQGEFEKTGKKVSHTRTTHYLVWFPLSVQK